ncbi:RHS repeat domain-containing protein [Luteimonas panaciterrae]|uniref:RHS repeat domain-containing protein n=1 Tax=Luteimonas panaciterrae TaxID=363885 RepID=UPI001CFB3C66|nr:RHS repeat-associated core domain-containing protein [Luteimonas panaciterrae]
MRITKTIHTIVGRDRKISVFAHDCAKVIALSAALFLSSTSLAGAAVLGYIDGITQVGTDYLLGGWACDTGVNASIDVHVYVGGPAGTGTGVAIATANKPSETAISTRCQTTGVSHRFSIPIPLAVRREHQGETIYVHGISRSGGSNLTIDNSGDFLVPAPVSVTRRYFYDGNERLCAMVEPETGTQFYQYDTAGNLIRTILSTQSAVGCLVGLSPEPTIDRTFDQRGRLKTLTFLDGKGDQAWTYTPDNLPASVAVVNPNVANPTKTTYTYNKRRLLTGEGLSHLGGTSAWGAGYGYNANGDLSVITYPSGFSIDYAPNALGQPTKAGAYVSSVKYHPNGAIASFAYGNGITHSMTQNIRQLPAKSVDSGGVLDDDYGYDKNGNVDHKWDNATGGASGRTMQYDGLDRLVQAFSPAFGGDNYAYYTYDGLDNIRTAKAHGNDYTYAYDAKWRLTNITNTVGGASVIGLGYDARGNLANKNGQTYIFDYGNRLRSSVSPSSYWYAYDGQGRRVLSCSPSACNYQMYSQAGQLLMTQDGRDSTRTESIYLGGSLVASHELNTTTGVVTAKYQHTDALGSPVATTDANGKVTERSDYDPYGKLLNRPLKDGPGYTGHVSDAATGLSYMQQRYYDPQVGRFLSVDPVTANTGTGGNFNRYWYANNNPYKFTDSDGREAGCVNNGCGIQDDRWNKLVATLKKFFTSKEFAEMRLNMAMGAVIVTGPARGNIAGMERESMVAEQSFMQARALQAARTPRNPAAYSTAFEMQLSPADFGKNRSVHFNRANAALDNALQADNEFASMMQTLIPGVQSSVSSVGGRSTPSGWTWEHASSSTAGGRVGVMRLVPSEQHTPGSAWWRVIHPDQGARGGYSEWAIPAGAPKN